MTYFENIDVMMKCRYKYTLLSDICQQIAVLINYHKVIHFLAKSIQL